MTLDQNVGQLGGVGGGAGDPLGLVPGLEPLLAGRLVSVRAQLDGRIAPALVAASNPLFVARVAGATAAPEAINLDTTLPVSPIPFRAIASPAWLRVTPAEGVTPNRLSVAIDPGTLSPGAYTGEVRVTSPGVTNSPLTLPATLVVTAQPSVVAMPTTVTLASGPAFPGGGGLPGIPGGALATTVRVTTTTPGVPFTASLTETTCPNAFAITRTANTTPAVVTVTANAAGITVPACTARLSLTSSSFAPFEVPLRLTVNNLGQAFAPAVTRVLNAASYQDAIAAPGTMLLLYGTNLGTNVLTTGQPLNGVWPPNLGGVSVSIGGRPAGIVYLQSGQASVVVPPGLASPMVPLVVTARGVSSQPVMVPTGPTAPGIFTPNAAGNGPLNFGDQPGGSLVAVLTGAGATTPEGAIAAPVTAQIGGQPATVRSAVAVATNGLYRVMLDIPAGLGPGNHLVQITVGERSTQPGVTVRVQ